MTTSFNMFAPSLPFYLALFAGFIICFMNFNKNKKASWLCLSGLILISCQIIFTLGSALFLQWWVSNSNNQGNNPQMLGFLILGAHIASSLCLGAGLILIIIAVFTGRQRDLYEERIDNC